MKAFIPCKSRWEAARQCPWACKIVKVENGYMAFEFATDYEIWRNQK